MIRVSRVGRIALFVFLLAVPAYAEPQIRSEIQYYDIFGSTARELRDQMNAHHLCADKGIKCDGRTDWFVEWNYQYRQDAGGCAIGSVAVTVDVKIQMPRWIDAENGSPALRADWERYVRNLLIHENGHRDFGVEAGRAAERAILELPAQNNCAALGQAADQAGNAAVDLILAQEIEYDRGTQHGKTQGARFG